MYVPLKYHHAIFELLQTNTLIEVGRLQAIEVFAAKTGILLPEAVREYLSLGNLPQIFAEYDVFTHRFLLDDWVSPPPIEGLSRKDQALLQNHQILPLFRERNEEWTWLLNLKADSNDPKMLLHSTFFPDLLSPHPHRFSRQLYLNVWDTYVLKPRPEAVFTTARSRTVREDTLLFLRRSLKEQTTSFIMIANETTYRFGHDQIYLCIIDNGQFATWHFRAPDSAALQRTLDTVQKKLTLDF